MVEFYCCIKIKYACILFCKYKKIIINSYNRQNDLFIRTSKVKKPSNLKKYTFLGLFKKKY